VHDLIEQRHGSFDVFAAVWEERITQRTTGTKVSRSTLYRWLADGVPSLTNGSHHRFFTLCGLLDVDPLSIFDFHRNGYFSEFGRLRQLIYYGRKALGGIATVIDMYRPNDVWPSEAIAHEYFGHGWRANHLTNKNDWNNATYILLETRFSNCQSRQPRGVHIAYRRCVTPMVDTMWRYYGTVLAIDGRIELYSESGAFQETPQANNGEIQFRTYFGGRPVEWRIASLHEFSMQAAPSDDDAVVTFTW